MKKNFLPFTFLMLLLLIVCNVYGAAHMGPLDRQLHHDYGFSTHLLMNGQLLRLFTSLFLTVGGWHFYVSLIMFALAAGGLETIRGTWSTVCVFFSIHIITTLILVFGISVTQKLVNSPAIDLLVRTRDVGPSAGYYGCLGVLICQFSSIRFRIAVTIVFMILTLRLSWSIAFEQDQLHLVSADLAHLIAFPFGLMTGRYFFLKHPTLKELPESQS